MGFPSESPFPQDSPTFFSLSEQCAPPPCSRLTHDYSPDTSHNASFSPPLVSAPAHQMMDKYFSNTPYTCTPIALSSFLSWNKHKNINLHHTHPLFVFSPAHLSLALCVSDTPCPAPSSPTLSRPCGYKKINFPSASQTYKCSQWLYNPLYGTRPKRKNTLNKLSR